jgi:hypothetical protein
LGRGGVKNKRFGSKMEREYANILRSEGYIVERAGSSIGDYDLIGLFIGNTEAHSLWVQVKAGSERYIEGCRRRWTRPSTTKENTGGNDEGRNT